MDQWDALKTELHQEAEAIFNSSGEIVLINSSGELEVTVVSRTKHLKVKYIPTETVRWETPKEYGFEPISSYHRGTGADEASASKLGRSSDSQRIKKSEGCLVSTLKLTALLLTLGLAACMSRKAPTLASKANVPASVGRLPRKVHP